MRHAASARLAMAPPGYLLRSIVTISHNSLLGTKHPIAGTDGKYQIVTAATRHRHAVAPFVIAFISGTSCRTAAEQSQDAGHDGRHTPQAELVRRRLCSLSPTFYHILMRVIVLLLICLSAALSTPALLQEALLSQRGRATMPVCS